MIRQPIVAIMGHVDHGKTLILDQIRGTAIAAKEAGGITQAIGASIIPLETLKKVCGDSIKSLNINLTIPGLLFIDTPGHAAFTTLRKRGGNLADIAILIIDINEGFKPQTLESIEILKSYKTPFIIAANKIDLIKGWRSEKLPILQLIEKQEEYVKQEIDKKLYEIVGKIYEKELEAERFDRVENYSKQVAIVPVSALTGDGIADLLMVLTGLTQKYLEQCLECDVKGPAKGTVLEVKEEKGLGKTMDVIIYNGSLKVGDTVVIGTMSKPIQSRVKAMFLPAPLAEMRDKKAKFKSIKEVSAATGVKLVAPGTDDVVSGMPIVGGDIDIEKAKQEVQQEVGEVLFASDSNGIIIKADSLGSLEALSHLLKEKNIPIKKAAIGNVTKRDISDAEANFKKNPLTAVILGFNISPPESPPENIKIITHDVIYKVIEDYEKYQETTKKAMELKALGVLSKPCKIQLMKGYTFRQSNPAIVGVEVMVGTLTNGVSLMNQDTKLIAQLKGIQLEQKNVEKAEKNQQVAISLPGVIVGRQIKEGDILYTQISEEEFRKFKEYKQYLSNDEKELLKEIASMMRVNNPVWGI